MDKVSVADLETAMAWLQENDGEEGEGDSCQRVANWIGAEIRTRKIETAARAVAKEHGVSLAAARRAVRKRM